MESVIGLATCRFSAYIYWNAVHGQHLTFRGPYESNYSISAQYVEDQTCVWTIMPKNQLTVTNKATENAESIRMSTPQRSPANSFTIQVSVSMLSGSVAQTGCNVEGAYSATSASSPIRVHNPIFPLDFEFQQFFLNISVSLILFYQHPRILAVARSNISNLIVTVRAEATITP